MQHLFNNTVQVRRSDITNQLGTQKETFLIVGAYPCRVSRSKGSYNEKTGDQIKVQTDILDLYTGPDTDIAKDDKVTIGGVNYIVLYVPYKHTAGRENTHHIYCVIKRLA